MPSPDETGATPATEATRWEYKTAVIPLNLSTRDYPDQQLLVNRAERLIRERVERESADGWEPDGAIDWIVLRRAGRIRRRQTSPFSPRGIYPSNYLREQVTVRLKRPVRGG